MEQTEFRAHVKTACKRAGRPLRDIAVGLRWPYSRLVQKLGGFQTMTDQEREMVRAMVARVTGLEVSTRTPRRRKEAKKLRAP